MITNDIILNLIKQYPSNYFSYIKKLDINFYNKIKNAKYKSFSENLYVYLYGEVSGCLECGNKCKFDGINVGYRKCCSKVCSNKIKIKNINKKYNTTNISKLQFIKDKKKKIFTEKYGVDSVFKLKNVIEKRNKSLKEKYNGNPLSDPNIRLKIQNKKRKNFIDDCINNIRIPNDIEPLFNIHSFTSITDRNLKFKCKKCNSVFTDHLMWGSRPICKICNPTSLFENEIFEYLKSKLNLNVERNNRSILNNLELDFFIKDYNIAIEANGLYWHSEMYKKDKNYHLNKTKMCNEKNIRLIHIFEDEWIYKKEIVKNRLKHILNKNTQKIYARKCEIKEISIKESKPFLEKYHIQGSDNSKIKLGLFYNNNLISVMTFGKLRFSLGNKNSIDSVYEMYRFCSNIQCVGGASKLLNYFIKTHNPKKIISYADNRWSDNNHTIYTKLKFDKVSSGIPNYWYIINGVRKHRFMYRKQNLKNILFSYDDNLTEWENMKNNGYDRIWDCGSSKFELILGDLK
jgi:hypothetical protein